MNDLPTQKWIISGRVQGVGYRYFVKSEAKRLGLNGYVRNLSNGNVEVVIQTTRDDLDRVTELYELCLKGDKGPIGSRVDSLEVVEENPTPLEIFQGFEIRY